MNLHAAMRRILGGVGVRIAVIALVVVGPLAAYQIAIIGALRQDQVDHALSDLDEFTRLSIGRLALTEGKLAIELEALSGLASRLADPAFCQEILPRLAQGEATLTVYDRSDRVLCQTGTLKEPLTGWRPSTAMRIFEAGDSGALVAAQRVGGSAVEWVAVALPIDFRREGPAIGRAESTRPTLHIIDERGLSVLGNGNQAGVLAPDGDGQEELAAATQGHGHGQFRSHGRDLLAAYQTTDSGLGRLRFIAEIPADTVLEPAHREARRMTIVLVLVMFMAGLIGRFATRRLVTRGLGQVARFAESLAKGEVAEPIEGLPSGGELGRVSSSLRRSMARLAARDLALHSSLTHWRLLAEGASDVITRSSADGRLVYVSPSSLTVLGFAPEAMLGRNYDDFVYLEDRWRLAHNRHRLLATPDERTRLSLRLTRNDGSLCWIEASCAALAHPSGEIEILIAARDVTTKARAEEELRRNESWFRSMAECAPVMIRIADNDRNCSYANRAWREFTGGGSMAVLDQGWTDSVHPEDRAGLLAAHDAAYRNQGLVTHEYRLRRHDGSWRTVIETAAPQIDPGGGIRGYVGSTIDVTDHYAVQEAFRQQWSVLRSVIDALPEALLVLDVEGRVKQANPAASAMFTMAAEGLAGRPAGELLAHPSGGPPDQALLDCTAFVNAYRRQSGEVFMGETVVAPIREDDGAVSGYVNVIRDVTEDIRVAREAQAARQAAEAANVSKTKFMAAASHDLRQPLHAMHLFLDSLQRRVSGAEANELVNNVKLSLESLDEMFGQLLDISRLEGGVIAPAARDVSFNRLTAIIAPQASRLAAERGLRFRVRPCNQAIRTDPVLFERILRNLVTNAIRYTRTGGVLVGCRRRGDTLRIAVWDSGRGIPDERMEEAFSEFHRIEEEGDDHRGLGLGLTIVRRLANVLGHRLVVASRPGRGSMFGIEVPLAVQTATGIVNQVERLQGGVISGAKIALIDDDPTVVDSTKRLLEDWGCEVTAARATGDLLAALKLAGRPDLVLCDYRLKDGVTGLMLVSKIRDTYGSDIPAIVITADTHRSIHQQIIDGNCRLLLKPLPPARLKSLATLLLNPLTADAG